MIKKTLGFLLFIAIMTTTTTQAQVSITYSAHGTQHFTLTIPDDWRINVGKETVVPNKRPEDERPPSRIITAMPSDGTPLWVGMWVPADVKNFKEAKEYIDSLGIELLTDVVIKDSKFETLNGMDVYYASGIGNKDDESMDFHAAFIQLTEETVAIAIYIGPHETTISHGKELSRMFQSLHAVKH